MNYLELHDICFSYGDRCVLDGVSFTASRGAFIGLVGQNGSGKTTLLKLMQGLEAPSCGRIHLDGVDLSECSARERALHVSSVWQRPTIAFGFTARQIVLMGRTPHMRFMQFESAEDRTIAEEAMGATETLAFADRPVSELSAGELQRVFLAAALAQQTSVLLLDEPTTHLDLRQAGRLSRLLDQQRQRELTIVCATHDLALLRRHADRVVVLKDSRVHRMGSPQDVLTRATLEEAFGLGDGEWYLDQETR